jgi:NADH-quinone oxidoreductase subunit N
VFVALARFFIEGQLYQYSSLIGVLSMVAIASMMIGNLLALKQNNVKRLLAYSSIAHFGYLLVVLIALAYQDGPLVNEAITFYLGAYILTTLLAFSVVATIAGEEEEKNDITFFEGLFWRKRIQAIGLTVAMLSFAGIPLTAGFMGKFYIISVGIQSGLWWLLAALVMGSAIAIYYYLRIIFAMSKTSKISSDSPTQAQDLLVIVLVAMVIILGSWPQPFIEIAGRL